MTMLKDVSTFPFEMMGRAGIVLILVILVSTETSEVNPLILLTGTVLSVLWVASVAPIKSSLSGDSDK